MSFLAPRQPKTVTQPVTAAAAPAAAPAAQIPVAPSYNSPEGEASVAETRRRINKTQGGRALTLLTGINTRDSFSTGSAQLLGQTSAA
ncbi:hypothetical protein [Hyphomicrobium sp. DY-1]|uniref:hypothetical protein n=1 Tax=Hyphomicrobium sp. DY-1 TaxID=3075650 RepID=UPI0039C2824E